MMQISILMHPNENKLDWSVEFHNPRVLEDRYVSLHLSNTGVRHEDPSFAKQREEYLRNRFRNYMNRFQLYKSQTEKLELKVELDQNKILVSEKNDL
jgi:hypothetical protein